jgi:dihydrofolate reductase
MIISLIVAMDEHRGIGVNNCVPWHLPDDLKQFKTLTMGHHIIMGRRTYESIGNPLQGRTMVVITNQQDYQPDGCLVVHSIADAIDLVETRGETEAFIIGGGEIFEQSLDMADRIYLSTVHTTVHAEVFFPLLDELQWTEIDSSHHPVDQTHQYPFTFTTLIRKTEN